MKCVWSEEWSENVRCLCVASDSFAFMITTFLNVLIICASMFKHVCVHDMVSVQCQSVQWQSVRRMIFFFFLKKNSFVDQSLPKYKYGM